MPLAIVPSLFAPLTPSAAGDAHELPPGMESCVTCGRPAGTPYCPHCGERRAADRVYTLGALAAEVWDHVTPADGRVLRSMWTLVRRPGALTAAYMTGVRQPFLAPLGVFFAVNGAFFAAAGPLQLDVLSKPLATHVRYNFYAETAAAMVRQRVAQRHTTFSVYAQRFDATVVTQSRSLVVAMVPAFAALIALAQVRQRRPALQHLAFGFHATAALLVVLVLGGLCVALPIQVALQKGWVRLDQGAGDALMSTLLLLLFGGWLAAGFRRAYGDGRWGAVGKAAVVASGTVVILGLYRAMLFFTAFWAT